MILATALSDYKPILEATTGILFLGTPHHGADTAKTLDVAKKLATWATLHRDNPSPLSVELKPFSDTIADITGEFKDIGTNFIMRSFIEQVPTDLPRPFGRTMVCTTLALKFTR
jgi:hypothetical protein